jgi:imidazolonepropionase-like amidohydrolase
MPGRVATLVAVLALLVAAPTDARAQQDADVHAFVGVTVIPMDSERTLPDQTVLVRDGLIVEMGPAGEVSVPADAHVIEGRGRYLMPGLAEMHAHVPSQADPPRDLVEETLFLYVANGITTIRGMLGAAYQLDLREEIRRGEVLGPHFYVGAPSVRGNTAATPAEAEARVREHHAAGYDFLKIHPGVPLDSWDRMVEVAREVGITYGGHVPADVGIHHAIETGMATIDHLDGFIEVTRIDGLEFNDRGARYRATDHEKLDALAAELAEYRVWQVPTQYLWNHLNGYVDPDSLLALPEFRYISPQLRENYRNRANSNRENPEITPESHRAHAEMRQEFLAAVHRAGAPILMGTDSPQLFNVPGFALHREIPLMEDAGMSPFEVLLSGTRSVAEYVEESLEQEGNFGTVAPGNRADLVLLEANPLADLAALQQRAGVMVAGRWVSREEIDRRLAAIAAQYADR